MSWQVDFALCIGHFLGRDEDIFSYLQQYMAMLAKQRRAQHRRPPARWPPAAFCACFLKKKKKKHICFSHMTNICSQMYSQIHVCTYSAKLYRLGGAPSLRFRALRAALLAAKLAALLAAALCGWLEAAAPPPRLRAGGGTCPRS